MRWDEYVMDQLRRRAGIWLTTLELVELASAAARDGLIRSLSSSTLRDQAWGAVQIALKELHAAGRIERKGARGITARWRVAAN